MILTIAWALKFKISCQPKKFSQKHNFVIEFICIYAAIYCRWNNCYILLNVFKSTTTLVEFKACKIFRFFRENVNIIFHSICVYRKLGKRCAKHFQQNMFSFFSSSLQKAITFLHKSLQLPIWIMKSVLLIMLFWGENHDT